MACIRTKTVCALIGATLAGVLVGCGGSGSGAPQTAWGLTDLATGSAQQVTTTGYASIQDGGTTRVYTPGAAAVSYPVTGNYILGMNGGIVSFTSLSFDLYRPGQTTPEHADFPDTNYSAPLAVDSQNRVYGAYQNGGGPATLWVYDGGSFSLLASPVNGTVRKVFLKLDDSLYIQLEGPLNDHFLLYDHHWIDRGHCLVVNTTVDFNGLICGSSPDTGNGIQYASIASSGNINNNGYDATPQYQRAVGLGLFNNTFFANGIDGTDFEAIYWTSAGLQTVRNHLSPSTISNTKIVAVTERGVFVTYTNSRNEAKTAYFVPN